MENKKIILIDMYNYIYRAFHGNRADLRSSDGTPTNAIFTLSRMFTKMKSENPDAYMLAVYEGVDNFRQEIYEDYKQQRKEMPDDLKLQIPYIRDMMVILGIPTLDPRYDGSGISGECDDIIATLSVRAAGAGYSVHIKSSDKDFRQLVQHNIVVEDDMSKVVYDVDMVRDKLGVYPKDVVGFLALDGDAADNIPGVPKWGPKTIARYINEYHGIYGVIENADKIKGVVGENLRLAIKQGTIDRNIELVTLQKDLPISLTKRSITQRPIDQPLWIEFCKKLNINWTTKSSLRI